MKECNEIRLLFVDAIYQQLTEQDHKIFQEHLSDCAKCASAYRNMSRTARVMSKRKRKEPDEAFWNGYWDRLSDRMEKQKIVRRTPWWISRVAAVALLVGVGVLIGRFYSRVPSGPVPTVAKTTTPSQTIVPLDQRVNHFLGRSEVLLLGLVNVNPGDHDPDAVNWNHQKKISQELIQEAKVLQGELETPERRRMHKLVSDLEVILLQIANLEAENDLPEIELVKNGVDRKGILLKINLEQLRSSSPQTNSEKPGI